MERLPEDATLLRRLRCGEVGVALVEALARKLAALFWQTMVKGTGYVEQGLRRYQARAAQSEQHVLRKLAQKHGLDLVPLKTMG